MASLNNDADSQTQASTLSNIDTKTQRLLRPTTFKNILSNQPKDSPEKQEPDYFPGMLAEAPFDPQSPESTSSSQKADAFTKLMATRRCQGRLIAKYRAMDQLNEVEEDSEQLFRKEKLRKERRPKVETSDAFTFLMTNREEPPKPKRKRVSFSRKVSRILHNDRRVDYGHSEIPDIIRYVEQDGPLEDIITEKQDINFAEVFKEEVAECVIPVVEKPDPLLGVPRKDVVPLRQPGFGRLLPIPVLAKIARKAKLEKEKQPPISKFLNKRKDEEDSSNLPDAEASTSQTDLSEIIKPDEKENSTVASSELTESSVEVEKEEVEHTTGPASSPPKRRSSRVPKKVDYFHFSDLDSSDAADKENFEQNNLRSPRPQGGSKAKKQKAELCTPLKPPSEKENRSAPKPAGGAKIASIFQKKSKEPILSPTKLKARQEFLFSPTESDDLLSNSQKSVDDELPWPPFPEFSHVRQFSDSESWNLSSPQLELSPIPEDLETSSTETSMNYMDKKFPPVKHNLKHCPPIKPNAMFHILNHLKKKNADFDVVSTFKMYEESKSESVNNHINEVSKESDEIMILSPEKEKSGKRKLSLKLNKKKKRKTQKSGYDAPSWQQWDPSPWVHLFAPKSSKHFIGNKENVLQMKNWLEEWKGQCESDDFSGKYCENSNSSYLDESLTNTILLTGAPGIGKTTLVYALAEELGFKVLEINASSRRNGKHVINQLSEATQSHSVSGSDKASAKLSQDIFIPKTKTSSKRKKSTSETKTDSEPRKNMALILFEDIDVVFDEYDEGFISAVNQFMITTKRPIVLTCNSSSTTAWSKIRGNPHRIHLEAPPPQEVAQNLQLMCLANGVFTSATEVEFLVKFNGGDVRKSIQDLQFWTLTGTTKIQWLTMECRNKSQNETEDHKSLKSILGCETIKRIAETPISSIWLDPDIDAIKSNLLLNSSVCLPVQYKHLDPNLEILLPFNLEIQPAKPKKYPLSSNDLLVKQAILKSNWVCLEEESEELRQIEEQLRNEDVVKPSGISRTNYECIDAMSSLYNSLADLDILDSIHRQTAFTHRVKYATGLNDAFAVVDDISVSQMATMDDVTSDVCSLSYKIAKKSIEDFKGPSDCLNVIVSKNPSVSMDSSVIRKTECDVINDVNAEICGFTPFSTRISTSIQAIDYIPFTRQFARSDELGKFLQKTRRHKRYLGQLKQTGYYLSPETCILASNMLL